jgi:hypothetical protein
MISAVLPFNIILPIDANPLLGQNLEKGHSQGIGISKNVDNRLGLYDSIH